MFIVASNNANFELLGLWHSRVHCFLEHFHSQYEAFLHGASLDIVVFQLADGCDTVLAGGIGLPRGEVAGGVGVVELEAADFVESSVHEGDTVGA